MIEREGTDEAVTLRAVAREVGIAAPSIYAHFQDRGAIMLAVVARVFDELTEAISARVRSAGDDPVERLVAGCEGYVDFGLSRPARYRILFSEHRRGDDDSWREYCKPVSLGPGAPPVLEFGSESFALLVNSLAACIAAGRSDEHRRRGRQHCHLGRPARHREPQVGDPGLPLARARRLRP